MIFIFLLIYIIHLSLIYVNNRGTETFLMFIKKVSYAQQGCINLIKTQ